MHNLWGLPKDSGRPILWIMCDEKWFHALVPRSNAKACETLGLKKSSYSAHHKSHIGKVMIHCTVGYLFKDNPELGGQGFLIGVNRCAGFKLQGSFKGHSRIDSRPCVEEAHLQRQPDSTS